MIKISEQEYYEHRANLDGICLACEEWTLGGVESDAQGYGCQSCGELEVFGTEEALLMGELEIEE